MSIWFPRLTGRFTTEGDDPSWRQGWRLAGLVLAILAFVLVSTLIIALDSILPGDADLTALVVGDVAPQDIHAPVSVSYESEVLTERAREAARANVAPVYSPPDPAIARQQIQLSRQILDYVDAVRRDPFGTMDQKIEDLSRITALTIPTTIIRSILAMDDETWRAVDGEIINVLERVMRESIRDLDLAQIRDQLPTQVSVRFDPEAANVVVAVVEDLVRTNRFADPEATEAARLQAAADANVELRTFERGQIVIRAGTRIDDVDYEALDQLGLLDRTDLRAQVIARALLASLLVTVVAALAVTRYGKELALNPQLVGLLAAIFLIMLLLGRVFLGETQIYLYPGAALALLFVAVANAAVAIMGVLGLAWLVGLMSISAGNPFEAAALIVMGGMIGALILRRSERLNSYFFAGLVIAIVNTIVVTLFNLEMLAANDAYSLSLRVVYAMINGIVSAMAALAGMYLVTLIFNLPTSLKLVELSQPNQPLLQRLLREAPGTYQHSLQVANLCEQAANAVGANAELVRVAALYHDLGKMLNPAFFVENQVDSVNPHDVLNDPYRSADIIISHVTDGDRLARQYRLPSRIRDFIIEHHGTTLVSYFYNQAISQADEAESVDIDQFTYPGPRPRTRETAIMMLADTCESTVRARKPTRKQEIADIVQQMIDARLRAGQLDDSYLTLNDLNNIRSIFIEMLQAVFHPRINYPPLPPAGAAREPSELAAEAQRGREIADTVGIEMTAEPNDASTESRPVSPKTEPPAKPESAPKPRVPLSGEFSAPLLGDDDEAPLLEVPPLRRGARNSSTMKPQDEPQPKSEDDVRD